MRVIGNQPMPLKMWQSIYFMRLCRPGGSNPSHDMTMEENLGERSGLEAASIGRNDYMNSDADVFAGDSAPRGRKSKARRKQGRGRPRKTPSLEETNGDPELAAPGSLTRTKALLLAALRVWELKHRIGD
jgi:hypothetical protein